MAKVFGNLHLVLVTGLVLAIVLVFAFTGWTGADARSIVDDVFRWLHLFFGITWIGLLYYFNFVQVPTMPKVPAELKKGVTGYIAPSALFFFRWGAALTVLTGLIIAFHNGYGADALTFQSWLAAKLWVFLPLTFLFTFTQLPMLLRHGLSVEGAEEEKTNPPPAA